jgi:hypothetical protein
MASSRWKRFAFFERHSLNLASEVLEDLIPIGGSIVNLSDASMTTTTADGTSSSGSAIVSNTRSSTRRSMASLSQAAAEASNDCVSLVVTTAALPLNSKPPPTASGAAAAATTSAAATTTSSDEYTLALNDMWSSLTACNPIDLPGNTTSSGKGIVTERNIILPSQAQTFQDDSNVVGGAGGANNNSVDGLVLVFATSRDTDRIHCFDVTVRCNPLPLNNITASEKDLEDLDGWRGYIAPLKGNNPNNNNKNDNKTTGGNPTNSSRLSAEERIIAEHMGGGSSSKQNRQQEQKEGIVGIATTRASSGHRPVHMACISHTNIVVCVDPHLHLSWYVTIKKLFVVLTIFSKMSLPRVLTGFFSY